MLAKFRKGDNLEKIIRHAIYSKEAIRGGMDNFERLNDSNMHSNNRGMTVIDG